MIRWLKKVPVVFVSLTFLLVACAIQPQTTTTSVSVASQPALIRIPLIHSPLGRADLRWNSMNHTLTVTVAITGLAPKSVHLVHIHTGNCAMMGQIVHGLNPVVANAHGVGSSTTTIAGVLTGIPASGWGINVHNGATFATGLDARPIACGNVIPTTIGGQASAHVILAGTTSPDEHVHGLAQIRFMDRTIIITLSLSGLAPNTTHMAHIHAGSCAVQGPVLYPLQPVTADAQGNAMTVTTIQVKAVVPARWYINIHEAATMAAMMNPSGFNPIACGGNSVD